MFPKFKFTIERWKWSDTYDVYVSTEGRIKDRDKDNVEISLRNTYPVFFSEKAQRWVTVHRAVLETWRPRKDMMELTVEHKDMNKRNSSLRNLMWLKQEENERRGRMHDIVETTTSKPSKEIIRANGINMTVDEVTAFLFNGSLCGANISKVALKQKIIAMLDSDKLNKRIYGVTLERIDKT